MASLPEDPVRLTAKSGRVRAAGKLARRAFRQDAGRFLVEGPQAVREALRFGVVVEVFDQDLQHLDWRPGPELPWRNCDPTAIAALSSAQHPQGIVAVAELVQRPLDDVAAARLVVVCADVRDPGNAGTVIRCADAVGADYVVLTGDSVDPHNGKAVRASVGSLFHLPVVLERSTELAVARLRSLGYQILAATGDGEQDLDQCLAEGSLTGPTAWIFGNEAWGLPDDVAALADRRVRIPIYGRAESLNLATAAAVCLYASTREQRR